MRVADYLQNYSQQVTLALDYYTSQTWSFPAQSPLFGAPKRLVESMRYSLLAGGKRLRPVLVIAAAGMFGLPPERVMPTACAVEMIHTYSLIHDDLPCMDDDDLRRGRPTNHKVFGDAMATLAGDALLTLAFELVAHQATLSGTTADQAIKVVCELAAGSGPSGMVGGQVEDLTWEGKIAGPDQLERIHRMKTGALIRSSLRVGAILGGATADELVAIDRYADHLGLAFQIQDDILDVIGEGTKTGKGVGRDQRKEKSTFVVQFGIDGAQDRARAEVIAATRAVENFGDRAEPLVALAEFVIDREI